MPAVIVTLRDDLEALDRYNDCEVSISLILKTSVEGIVFAAVAQADRLDDRWWVSRVLVPQSQARGQGLGSIAVQRMLAVIAGISDRPVYVSPGGYQDNTEQQYRFYLRNGFRRIEPETDCLVWTRTV